jgi:hypothetical protein
MNKELLHEMFNYKDGEIYRKNTNKMAGSINGNGYRQTFIKGKIYKNHRLIWMYHNGDIENRLCIDHINQNRIDNRIENLRLATISQNTTNAKKQPTNTTGYKGVVFEKKRKKYRASIIKNKKTYYLGSYSTAQEAHKAYKQAAVKLHGDFACWE